MLKGKTVVLGVTGCIAAYKACEIVSSLKKKGATVIVIMTPHSTEFVQPLSFETLSGNRVITDLFDRDFDFEVEHVALAKRADVFVVGKKGRCDLSRPRHRQRHCQNGARHCGRYAHDDDYGVQSAQNHLSRDEYEYVRKRKHDGKYRAA